jgi:serine phosphatase RsbU (regulator of sigma subunit)
VSGDFYLLTNGPDGTALAVVGDVVGHGPASAQLATFVRASLASFAANTSDPAEILAMANRALLDRPEPPSDFVTAVCVSFRPAAGEIVWAVAGHPPPLRLPALDELPTGRAGLPLGLERDLRLTNASMPLCPDEGVLIYTDGVTDARRQDALLGPGGLRRLLAPLASLPASELVSGAQRAVLDYANQELRDDLCILALRQRRTAAAP